jgi:hypothetical protein
MSMGAPRWSSKELGVLSSYFQSTKPRERSIAGLAKLINRTHNSITIKANRMGYVFERYTPEEIELVKKGYAEWDGKLVTIQGLAKSLGVLESTFCSIGKKLGLTNKKRPKPYLHGLKQHIWKEELAHLDQHRERARKLYPLNGAMCEKCKVSKAIDRHHKDENPKNNAPDNIAKLCRACHMIVDGRMDAFANKTWAKKG